MRNIRVLIGTMFLLGWFSAVVFSQIDSDKRRMEYIQKNKCRFPHDSLVVFSKYYFLEGKIQEAKALHDSCFIQKQETNDDRKIMTAFALWEAVHQTNKALFSTVPGKRLKEAINYLNQAGLTDSVDAEMLFLMGKYFMLMKKPEEAVSWYRKAIRQDEMCYTYGFRPVWMELGEALESMGKKSEAAEAYEKGTLLYVTADDTWPMISLAFKLLRLGREDRFSESFTAGLYNIRDSLNIDSLYYDCVMIASDEEKAEWDSLQTKNDKLEFFSRFWKSRDLDLTTEINERLVEHYKRLFYAREVYFSIKKPWLDDRGTVYIRLGKPDKIYHGSPHGNVGVDDGFLTNSFRGVDIIAGVNIYANESWIYKNPDYHFDFVNEMGWFELKPLFKAAGHGSAPSIVNQQIKSQAIVGLYADRSSMDPVYDILKKRMVKGEIQDLIIDYEKNCDNAKKQRFINNYSKPHLPLTFSFSSFRDKNRLTAVDFYYVIPLNELVFGINQSNLKNQTASLTVWLSVYDHQFKEVLTKKYEMNILKELSFDQSNYYLDVRRLQLKPGTYHIGFRALSDTVKEGIYKAKITVPDYSSGRLQISDIQTAFRIDEGMNADKYTKPGTSIRVLPNPGRMINKSKPLFVYYEIYGLTLDGEGKSRYQIEYRIMPDKSKGTFLRTITNMFAGQDASTGSITVKEGQSTVSREYIAFDVSEVPTGETSLEIAITDLNTQHQTKASVTLTLKTEK